MGAWAMYHMFKDVSQIPRRIPWFPSLGATVAWPPVPGLVKTTQAARPARPKHGGEGLWPGRNVSGVQEPFEGKHGGVGGRTCID